MISVGAIAAGVPINYIATAFDWFTAFMCINVMALGTFMILVVGKDIKATYLQTGGGPPKLSKKAE